LDKGSYILLIKLPEEKELEIGSLGVFEFEPGLYFYVGSGMNGLDKRVGRHLSDDKKKHWHIDYLLDEAEVVATVKFRTKERIECDLSNIVSEIADEIPVAGFGSSDCPCKTHLFKI